MTPPTSPRSTLRSSACAAAATSALLISGCVAGVPDGDGNGDTAAATSDPARFTMAFAGDVHFERQIAAVAEDPNGLDDLRPLFAPADFAMVNLETAITEAFSPMPGKRFTFSAPESALTTLSNAGIDAVSMANNHAADHGPAGLLDTLAAKESGEVPIVGLGRDAAEAFAPLSVDLNGASVAVLAASALEEETYRHHEAGDDQPGIATFVEPDRMLESVRAADANHDVVVAYMHMGAEGLSCVTQTDIEKVDSLQRAGADIVVLSHAHRLAGIDRSEGTFAAYGLGNFVWYTGGKGGPSSNTGVLTVDVDVAAPGTDDPGVRVSDHDFEPLVIGSDGIPAAPSPARAAAIMEDVAAVDTCG